MPLYEYECPRCAERKEVLARNAEEARPPRCSVCGVALEKRFSAAAVPAKGGDSGCAPRGGFS